MKVGTDGVLLGAWAAVRPQDRRMLDIGTGTGLIALMLAQRAPEAHVTGVDIDDVGQARENAAASPWSGRVAFAQCPVQEFETPEPFDLIVSNPPFFVDSLTCPDRGAHRGPPCRAPAVRRPARRRPPPAGSRRPVCRHPSHGRSGAFPRGLCRATGPRAPHRRAHHAPPPGQTGADGVRPRRPPRRPPADCSADRPADLPPIVPPPCPRSRNWSSARESTNATRPNTAP